MRFDELEAAFHVHALDFSTAAGEVTHDLAHAVFGNADLHIVYRFEQAWACHGEGFFKTKIPRDLKRDVLRIDRVHLAVVKVNFDIDHPVAGHNAFFASLHDALLDRGHEHAVHVLAGERLREFDA